MDFEKHLAELNKKKKEKEVEEKAKEQYNWKVSAKMIERIVVLAIEGYTSNEVSKQVSKEFGKKISSSCVRYYRLKNVNKIAEIRGKELDRAIALYPLATIEGRFDKYSHALEKEMKRKKVNWVIIAKIVALAGRDIQRSKTLELRALALSLKQGKGEDQSAEEFVDTIEKRIKQNKNKKIETEFRELIKIVGWDYVDRQTEN